MSGSRRSSTAILRIEKDEPQGNNTTSEPVIQVKESKVEVESSRMTIIIVVVAIIALIIIVILIIVFIVCYRRQRKPVKPVADERSASPEMTEGEYTPDGGSRSQSKLDLLAAQFYPTPVAKNNQLPPLVKHDMSIGTDEFEFKKKRSRKRKKDRELEIFDGTRTYEMEADLEFFASKDKSKIKKSARSIKGSKTDLEYWITVKNGYLEHKFP